MTHLSLSDADDACARGVKAQQAGNLGKAMDEWKAALETSPDHEDSLYYMAVALASSGNEKDAEEMYHRVLAQNPVHREALFNLANMKLRQEDDRQAEGCYMRLTEAHPEFIGGWINFAKLLSDRGEFGSAESLLCKAFRIDPANAVAHWNFAHILLRKRDWKNAWREYEWRLNLPHWLRLPTDAPPWVAGSTAKRVLLWNDQGIGDAIQFLRYPQFLAAKGCEVFVLVQDNFKTLAATAPGVAKAFGPSDPLPQVDAQAPLLSLPHRLSMPAPGAAGSKPYLKAGKAFDIGRKEGRKAVGLAWAGNQAFKNDQNRSAAFSCLEPLFDVKEVDFFSLQFGPAAQEMKRAGLPIEDLMPRLRDFSDTAAAIYALDLVISVDTAVAHLAGAMGRPCWLMLAAKPDWRWIEDGDTSSWYPSARLFKQKNAGNWEDVVERIKAALENE